MKVKTIILFFIGFLIPCMAYGQCCGAGNPISTIGSETAVKKGNIQISLDYRHSASNEYYEGSHKTDFDFPGKISEAGYNYMALGVGYGITSRLTAQVQLGYYIDKYEKYKSDMFPDVSASGVGDLMVSANYAVFRKVSKGISINPFIGVKFPIGKFDCESEGVKLPISMQPSSGSYKYLAGLFATWSPSRKFYFWTNDFFEYPQRIQSRNFDYKYGNVIYASISGNYRINRFLDGGIQFSYENKGRAKSDNKPLYGTVYNQLTLIPTVLFYPYKGFTVIAQADIPVWKNAEGIQMVNSWAVEFKVVYNIKL